MKTVKVCSCCNRVLPIEMFYPTDKHTTCKECHRARQRLWYNNQFRIFTREPFDMGILLGLGTDELLFIGEQKTREYCHAIKDQEEGALLA